LSLLGKGIGYKAAAEILGSTPLSLRVVGHSIHRKLRVNSKTQLALWAVENRKALQAAEKAIETRRAPG
jgi:DNA-binding CsgD family transcriptional regulator